MISRHKGKVKIKESKRIHYNSIGEVLDDMDGANGAIITEAQIKAIRDLIEIDKVEYRNKMLKIAGIAYEAGRKFSWNEFEALKTDVIKGGFDVRM